MGGDIAIQNEIAGLRSRIEGGNVHRTRIATLDETRVKARAAAQERVVISIVDGPTVRSEIAGLRSRIEGGNVHRTRIATLDETRVKARAAAQERVVISIVDGPTVVADRMLTGDADIVDIGVGGSQIIDITVGALQPR